MNCDICNALAAPHSHLCATCLEVVTRLLATPGACTVDQQIPTAHLKPYVKGARDDN